MKGLPGDIPPRIDVDVSSLDIGDAVHVEDLRLEKIKIMADPDQAIATVIAPTVEEEEVEEVDFDEEDDLISSIAKEVEIKEEEELDLLRDMKGQKFSAEELERDFKRLSRGLRLWRGGRREYMIKTRLHPPANSSLNALHNNV